jgi:hypothetical protein
MANRSFSPRESQGRCVPSPSHGDTKRAPPDLMHRVMLHVSPNVVEGEASGGDAVTLHMGVDREEQHKERNTEENGCDKRHIWKHKQHRVLDLSDRKPSHKVNVPGSGKLVFARYEFN